MVMNINMIKELRRTLHSIPEPSMKEVKTKRLLMDFLRSHTGLEIVDRGAWFYAYYQGQDTEHAIAFRADYDAVVCQDGCARHLCGHDGHSAILVGFALELERIAPRRSVYLIFQPGEETGQGASLCSSLIDECNITEIYGIHNIPGYTQNEVLLLDGTFACASTGMEISIQGSPAHAAYPQQGKNPALLMADLITYMDALVNGEHHGIVLGTVIGIEAGSCSYGMSADRGILRLTLRAEYQEEYDELVGKIRERAEQQAKEQGMTCTIRLIEPFPATINHPLSVHKVRTVARSQGLSITIPKEPFRWSEDFGYYLQKSEGAFLGIGCGEEHAGLHTADYEFDDAIIGTVINIYEGLLDMKDTERDYFLTTDRIGFSEWKKDDIELAELLWGDPDVTRYICASGKFSAAEITARLEKEIDHQAESTCARSFGGRGTQRKQQKRSSIMPFRF